MKSFLLRLRDRFSRGEPVLGEATLHDVAPIARLHAQSFRRGWSEDEIERLLLDKSVLTHRAQVGRAFAGFIMSRLAADEAEILTVAVSPARKGAGLGRKLLMLHLGRLMALGVKTVFLEVDEGNISAVRLYRRAGFRDAGRREGYYARDGGKPASALVLRRDLA
jgi:ribosomal-protein-alanine N-acetyltransferase